MDDYERIIVRDFMLDQSDEGLREVIELARETLAQRAASRPRKRQRLSAVTRFMRGAGLEPGGGNS